MTLLNFSTVISPTYVDGPGRRAALFVQGCPIRCPGCQNRALWEPGNGYMAGAETIARTLLATGLPITITGGEPFAQPEALAEVVRLLKDADRHVILYTGFVLEDLLIMAPAIPAILYVLQNVDVLVDGPYVRQLDSPWMQYRGSANQRVIDMPATWEAWRLNRGWDYETLSDHLVLLDWDTEEIIVSPEGDLLAAEPVAMDFGGLGELAPTRRCGQQREVQRCAS